MTSLVLKSDLDELKYIADSVKNTTIWPQFVSEAEMLDVKSWLGDPLLYELLTQAGTTPETFSVPNQKLLNGGSYTYLSKTYLFQGLKKCIIYYAFARFTNRSPFNYTAAGIVTKDTDFSTPASDKVIQRLETEARLTADALKCEIIAFLNRNYTLYPLWTATGYGCATSCNDNRPFTVVGD
jgi:hypothetical protein